MPKELTVRDNKLKDLIYALCKARMHPQLLDEFVSRPNDPEFKRIYEYLDAIGLVSKFGTAKTDESGQPLPTDEGDLWRYYLGPFLVGLMPRQPWEGEFEEAYQELEESLF